MRRFIIVLTLGLLVAACGDATTDDGVADTATDEATTAAPTSEATATAEPTTEAPTEEATTEAPEGEMSAIEGDWYLTEAEGVDAALPPLDQEITLTVEGARLAGMGGCNNYNAGFELHGDHLIVEPVVSTRMACEPAEVMDAEMAYLAALEQVDRATVEGDELVLDGGGVTLRFASLMVPVVPDGDGSA